MIFLDLSRAVGPPARIATACGGGTTKISTLRRAVPKYASAQPLDFLARAENAFFDVKESESKTASVS